MIVAIARELGAGGREVGEKIARLLGADLLANEIVDLVARRLGAPADYVAERDEQVESFADRLFRAITAAYPEEYTAQNVPDWSEDRLQQLTASIIEERAREQELVVIGRGAAMLLKDRPDVVRLFVTASQGTRIRRLRERTGCSAEDAVKEIQKSDQHRAAYYRQYYGADWRDLHSYDLVINTDRVSVDEAAELAVAAAKAIAARVG